MSAYSPAAGLQLAGLPINTKSHIAPNKRHSETSSPAPSKKKRLATIASWPRTVDRPSERKLCGIAVSASACRGLAIILIELVGAACWIARDLDRRSEVGGFGGHGNFNNNGDLGAPG